MVERPKPGERMKMLPRSDPSEMPTDSDATIPDKAAYEPATILDRKKQRPKLDEQTNLALPILGMAVVLVLLVLYAVFK
jgi:hypothetical protein